ncbi:hypothetical protein EN859_010345 [Mesorhizobium sp. M00.F.Ca.ET.216.01.1.1]|nr:hypothetical protein EN859_010345 [Mesorhizobium sp. M00.F.Ca.ET.216.01.1.1]
MNSTRQFIQRQVSALLGLTKFKLPDHLFQRNTHAIVIPQAFLRNPGVLPILNSLKDGLNCDLIDRAATGLGHVGQQLLGFLRQFDCDHGKLHP